MVRHRQGFQLPAHGIELRPDLAVIPVIAFAEPLHGSSHTGMKEGLPFDLRAGKVSEIVATLQMHLGEPDAQLIQKRIGLPYKRLERLPFIFSTTRYSPPSIIAYACTRGAGMSAIALSMAAFASKWRIRLGSIPNRS